MKLKSVRVENFKCVEDSTDFSVERVTCLVGKNEAGKSALLEALYKLNPVVNDHAKFDAIRDYPRRHLASYQERVKSGEAEANVLTTLWELAEEDKEALKELLGPEALKITTAKVAKGYSNKQHCHVEIDEKEIVKHIIQSSKLDSEEGKEVEAANTISELVTILKGIGAPSQNQSNLLTRLQKDFPNSDLSEATAKTLKSHIPKFVYFSEYYKLPGQVAIDDFTSRGQQGRLAVGDLVFLALLDLVGTKPQDIQSIGKFEPLIAKLEAVSNRISQEIFTYWSQNKHLEVEFRFDAGRTEDPAPYNSGYVFRTRIRNTRHGVTVSFDERSSGFVWFFSFLIWFSQVKKTYGDNLVILLDEPGLGLHARAQGDLLRYINEKLEPEFQVVYTAHSPFMIDPDNLLSARTVEDVIRDERIEGTKVGDKIFSTDADTVFPLQAALGYDLTQTLFVGKHTLLVEGPSDLLYLKWFSRELEKSKRTSLDSRWVISPCGGIDKVGSFVALFGGNRLHVAVFTDYHQGTKKKIRDLRESDLLRKGHVFSAEKYAAQDEADTEDLIGRINYVRLVNKCYDLDEAHSLPEKRPARAPIRVLEEVESHFITLPPQFSQFNHYAPASYLIENPHIIRGAQPELDKALERFENLFKDLNALLTD